MTVRATTAAALTGEDVGDVTGGLVGMESDCGRGGSGCFGVTAGGAVDSVDSVGAAGVPGGTGVSGSTVCLLVGASPRTGAETASVSSVLAEAVEVAGFAEDGWARECGWASLA